MLLVCTRCTWTFFFTPMQRGKEGEVWKKRSMATPKLPSVALVHPSDVPTLAKACEVCICALLLEGCGSCERFAHVWRKVCAASKKESVLRAHVSCADAASKAGALELMQPRRSTFPCVLVYKDGRGAPIPYAGDMDDLDAPAVLQLILRASSELMMGDDDLAPFDLESEDGEEEAYEEEEEEVRLPDDEEEEEATQGEVATGNGVTMVHGDDVAVTHDLDPPGVHALTERAHADMRVCVLYYTNWCGHCTHFKPVFNECVQKSARSRFADSVCWCAVNCESEDGQKMASRAGVRGFPTLRVHHKFDETYAGSRTPAAILKFVTRRGSALKPKLLQR